MSSQVEELVQQAEGIIVPYSDEYEEAHTLFAQKMWPQKRRRRVPEYVRWKFRGPAHGPVDGFLLAVAGGKVVGQLGVIPVTLQAQGQTYPAQWACDLMVDASLRRMRYGSLLLAAAMARPVISLGSDPSPAADVTMSRLGFRSLPGPRQMILPLQPLRTIKDRLPQRWHFLSSLLATLAKPWIKARMLRLYGVKSALMMNTGSWKLAAPLIQKQAIGLPHIVHDALFLHWRCQGLPGFSPELESVVLETGAFAVFQATPGQFFVYEWKANDLNDTRALLQKIVSLANECNSQTIVMCANYPDEQIWLRKLGFFSRRTTTKIIFYPGQPLAGEMYFHYCHYDSDGNL